ncbi:hypothetical protein M0813_20246 [Anaeramoeba flamelloides]|uniref:BTB domain-containing protein n=1 Tax=Anaeramoeba flamelloides TaxID=1746091 RepID=A0ABQ8YLE5_9EUKA|nr:hypothetical protein M0813_20246 [Anaeramoeba flamelloides]
MNDLIKSTGWSPFHLITLWNPDVELMSFMIKYGADCSAITNKTSLHLITDRLEKDPEKISTLLPSLEFLLENGCDQNLTDTSKKKPSDLTKIPIVTKLFETFPSFQQDFKQLYDRKELVDFKIRNFQAHKFLLVLRSGKSALELQKILKRHSDMEISTFLEWCYGIKPTNTNFLEPILNELEINPKIKTLRADIASLYTREDNKDFIIVVNDNELAFHKLVLQARSELYRGMFLSIDDKSGKVKDYTNKSIETIKLLAKFIYLDRIEEEELTEQIYKELEDVVDYYQLNRKTRLTYFLKKFNNTFSEKKK